MANKPLKTLILLCASMLVGLIAFESLVRLLVEPSNLSWGRIGALELPPIRLLHETSLSTADPDEPYAGLVIDGETITRSDLFGVLRPDPVVGYTVQENAVSTNGWWQSNNIGARATADTTASRPEGQRRALVFGESFTQGSRVKQDESWPYFLDQMTEQLEVVNLAVDGYSMGQAYLRYRQIRDRVDHDIVVLGFVPTQDLIRDVNTLRTLIGWGSSTLMPRFVLNGAELLYIGDPFSDEQSRAEKENANADESLLSHLRQYDSFFYEDLVSMPPIVGRLVAFKLFLRLYQMWRHQRLDQSMIEAGSEARRTVRAIIEAMARESADRDSRFVLVYIPGPRDIERIASRTRYAETWQHLVEFCPGAAICIDLAAGLQAGGALDFGYDGTHYGPYANRLIANIVTRTLGERGLVESRAYRTALAVSSN